MGIVNGTFIYNGLPYNGATAKLWTLTAFAAYADSTDEVEDAPLAAASIELNVNDGGLFAVGDVIKIESELLRIWAKSTNLLYVKRGWRGTTPAQHVQNTQIDDETVTEPAQDDAEPGSGQQGAQVTTGVAYGGDGAYRWDDVPEGEYFSSVEHDSHRAWMHHLVESDDPTPSQLLTTRGDVLFVGADGVKRLAKGAISQLLTMGANEPAWGAPPAGLPSGCIVIWHGTIANIPAGYIICDGNNDTPNLLTMFLQGVATAVTDPGATGGSTAKTGAGHQHNYPIEDADREFDMDEYGDGANFSSVGRRLSDVVGSAGSLASTKTSSTGASITDIRPKFYDVAFLMKT